MTKNSSSVKNNFLIDENGIRGYQKTSENWNSANVKKKHSLHPIIGIKLTHSCNFEIV